MGYKRHIFYQPECDYPDKLLHVESGGQSVEWFHILKDAQ